MAALPGTAAVELPCDFVAHFHERWINAVAISGDGQVAVSGGADRATHAFFVQSAKKRIALEIEQTALGPVYDVSLAAGALATATAAGQVRAQMLLGARQTLFEKEVPGKKAWAARLSRVGRKLVWCIAQTVVVTDLASGATLHKHESKDGVASLAITADAQTVFMLKKLPGGGSGGSRGGSWVDSCSADGSGSVDGIGGAAAGAGGSSTNSPYAVDVWDTAAGTISSTLFEISSRYWPAVASDADGGRVAIADDRFLRVLRPRESAIVTLPQYTAPDRLNAVAITPSGERLVAAVAGGDFAVWDCFRQTKVAALRCYMKDAAYGASPCAISDDGARVAAGCTDNCVRVWSLPPTAQAGLAARARARFRAAAAKGEKGDAARLSVEEAKIELNAFLASTEGLTTIADSAAEDLFFGVTDSNAEEVEEAVFLRMFSAVFKQQGKEFAERMALAEQQRKSRIVEELLTEHAVRFRNRAKPKNVLSFRMAVRVLTNIRAEIWKRYKVPPELQYDNRPVAEHLQDLIPKGSSVVSEKVFVSAVKQLVYDVSE